MKTTMKLANLLETAFASMKAKCKQFPRQFKWLLVILIVWVTATSGGYAQTSESWRRTSGPWSDHTPKSQAYVTPKSQAYVTPKSQAYVTAEPRAYVTRKSRAYVTPKPRAYVTPKSRTYVTPKSRTYVIPKSRTYVTPKSRVYQ